MSIPQNAPRSRRARPAHGWLAQTSFSPRQRNLGVPVQGALKHVHGMNHSAIARWFIQTWGRNTACIPCFETHEHANQKATQNPRQHQMFTEHKTTHWWRLSSVTSIPAPCPPTHALYLNSSGVILSTTSRVRWRYTCWRACSRSFSTFNLHTPPCEGHASFWHALPQ